MGAVDTTYTFTATDAITSAKMNNIIDQTTMTSDAVFTSSPLSVTGGKLTMKSGGITSNEMGADSVLTSAIKDGSITTAKISDSTSITTGVTTSKIADGAITTAKIADSTSTTTGVTTAKIADASITPAKLNGTQSGNAPIYGCRAWVNFDGTSGSTAIRTSGNVSGVVRDTTGRYTVTFTTAMPDVNYCVIGFARDANTSGGNYFVSALSNATKTTSTIQVEVNSPGGSVDSPEVNLIIIR